MAGLSLDLYLHTAGVIGPTLQMTVTTEESVTLTILPTIVDMIVPILQMTVAIEEVVTVTTLLIAVISPILRTIVTTIEGADIVPFLGAFRLDIGGPEEATHVVYHLGGQRGAIPEVYPGVVTLVTVILIVR